ncbi:MAG: SpoIIE family protein phosphatase [Gammaproteobacteria bacterium]|nr:SpoIIE family protein phosphatase [Gammaproteobacteria bacterium]
MSEQLLKHIRTLSDSRLTHAKALVAFAHCFHAVYGESSFISLEQGAHDGAVSVRMIFRAGAGESLQVEGHLNDEMLLENAQVSRLIAQANACIVEEIEPSLQAVLRQYQLPSASMMTIPLFLDGEIHRWVFVLGEHVKQFSEVDMEQAILLANLANTYMVRIDETEALAKANDWIERELSDIGRLHKLLLPQEDIPLKGTEVATYFSFCELAGGDYYDMVNLSRIIDPEYPPEQPDVWGLIVADASGHGAAAAVEIAMFDAILRTYHSSPENGPASVFNYTNKYFFTRTLRGSFITASILNYDPRSRVLRYANAGHPPVIMKTPQGEVIELAQQNGIPLGVDPEWQWLNTKITVEPGTVLVSYTDGMTEALSPQGKQFGMERFKNVIRETSGTAQAYKDALVSAVQAHQQGTQQDDQALVVMHIWL